MRATAIRASRTCAEAAPVPLITLPALSSRTAETRMILARQPHPSGDERATVLASVKGKAHAPACGHP
ncbi:MAG: hypothetical protein WDN49_23355 [Acetobacteraceae bacterium]